MKQNNFIKTANFCNKILKKEMKYTSISINCFNVIKSHSNYFSFHKVNSNNVNFFTKLFKYLKINFLKRKNVLVKKKDVLIISNLINIKKIDENDFYFSHVIRNIPKNKINILYRNIHKNTFKSKLSKNLFVTDAKRNIIYDIYFFFKILQNLIRIKFTTSQKNNLEKKILNKSFSITNILSSISNIIEVEKILYFIDKSKPKKIIFTLEGYAWENLLCYKVKNHNYIKSDLYGYYFSIISKFQNSPFANIRQDLKPDYILTSGDVAKKKFLKNRFDNQKLINIGSNKNLNNISLKKNRNSILILPEAFENEIFTLVDFAEEIFNFDKNLCFVVRLHPSISREIINKKIIYNIKTVSKNFIISNKSFEFDIKRSFCALYRGSGSIIEAASNGVYPIYLKKKYELSIDPLYEIENDKLTVTHPKEFLNNYYRLKRMRLDEYFHNISKISSYCNKYYMRPNKNNISKIYKK